MQVSIYFAYDHDQLWTKEIDCEEGTSLQQALEQAGFFTAFVDITPSTIHAGIYGQSKPLETVLHHGDRIEVYRPLKFDPMQSRQRRAQHRKAGILKKKHLKPDRSKHTDYMEYKGDQVIKGNT